MSASSKVIIGTLAGVTAGVVLGLLFAPDKGTETRRKISEKYGDLSESLRNKIADLVESAKEEYSNVRDKAREYAGKTGGAPNMKGEPRDTFTA